MTHLAEKEALAALLQWYQDVGADEALATAPVDRTIQKVPVVDMVASLTPAADQTTSQPGSATAPKAPASAPSNMSASAAASLSPQDTPPLGASEAQKEALALANEAQNLEGLAEALSSFKGISSYKTATHMVFAAGAPEARVMVIGEVPGPEDDAAGTPFVGLSGQLMDRILSCIGLSRDAEEENSAVYLTNLLNWRPPGNRSPTAGEVRITLPLIERHITLVQPQILLLCGGLVGKTLLGTGDSISRLRGRWHDYTPQTKGLKGSDSAAPIPALVTYHPSYLLGMPGQKKAVWDDMLRLQEKRRALGLVAETSAPDETKPA